MECSGTKWNIMEWSGTEWNIIMFHCLDLKNNNGMERSGMKYDGMNLISYYHLPSILFISFLKYPNNGTEYLFHSAPSYSTPLYSAPLHFITFYQSKRSLKLKSTGNFVGFLRIFLRILVLKTKTKRFEHTRTNLQQK